MNSKMIILVLIVTSLIILLMMTPYPFNSCSYDNFQNDSNKNISCNLFSNLNHTVINGQLIVQRYNNGSSDDILEINDNFFTYPTILYNYYFIMLTRICIVLSYLIHASSFCSVYFNIFS
jgi:hypothetical protein